MIKDNIAQIVLAVDFIAWVRLAEETYLCPDPIGDLYDWISIQNEQIKELKSLLSNSKGNWSKLLELMCQSLYLRQQTDQLLKNNITSTECFEWQKIPKLCMGINNCDIYLKQLNNKLCYCNEFLGNSAAAVIEPSTEKIWLNLGQAIMNRDVVCLSSEGQKIETVKQLGRMIAE